MAHVALYRAWRPQSFADMVGQRHIVRTLQNALREGRTTHAYLFAGPRGTGKTTTAKILAKAVNCRQGQVDEPCNECDACRGIADGSVLDVLEIDAASNRGVEEIREIRDKVKFAPTDVRRKVYIIDEVHMLTTEAFNALLKTLEEPPPHVMFILATTEPHKLPATIISRCQRYDFKRVSLEEQVGRLAAICAAEGVEAEKEALDYVARLSDGGMRDALSILDQVIAYTGGRVTLADAVAMTGGLETERFAALADALHRRNVGDALRIVEEWMQEGKSAEQCLENLIYYFRDLLVIATVPNAAGLTERITDAEAMKPWAERFAPARLFAMIDLLNRYQADMKFAAQPQTMFEVAIMKLCLEQDAAPPAAGAAGSSGSAPLPAGAGAALPPSEGDPSGLVRQLLQRIDKLEQQLASVMRDGAARPAESQRQAPARSSVWGSSSNGAVKRKPVKLDAFVQAADSETFRRIASQWAQVLGQVKQRKVTLHAWLKESELVSATDEAVLLAFGVPIHRETVDKPANREFIEEVMQSAYNRKLRLVCVMRNEWNEALAQHGGAGASGGGQTPPAGGEGLSADNLLQYESEAPKSPEKDWLNETIGLFGEELVVIRDGEE
ncbi:DNA polymerase III subunit gamma/tau [Paenibacillus thermoaerophilus]|uniref:DNA-directed DNA polymerase n=1 Tax=Paenibacillus thermoaerophilus TaxID=1215385 RepID=A0ABW2V724_9BACL|nr:DNA polymerase III subunit gamma/tau [Paenibacillus thermoaerophilus]TMV06714.1 DNA polymerase III subunit gamma/tau [Paenibacillus thermoaerophilus]